MPVATMLQDTYACRLTNFTDHQLDNVFINQQLSWLGHGNQQMFIAYPEDIHLLQSDAIPASPIEHAFADSNARYSFDQIISSLQQQARSTDIETDIKSAPAPSPDTPDNTGAYKEEHGKDAPGVERIWWDAVWSGRITSESLSAMAS